VRNGNLKPETRSPKLELKEACWWRLSAGATAGMRTGWTKSRFRFRSSTFHRVSSAGLSLLAVPCLFAAATNSLAPDEIPPLRPPQAEIPPSFWEQYGLWVVLLGVLLLILACAAAWFLTRPKPPMIVPPEVQARQALEPLRQQAEDGALLSRITQILRHYVAAAFRLPPGELTTAEFCHAVKDHGPIGPELSAALTEFLHQCDQRKFSLPAPPPPFSAVAQALKLTEQAETRRLALARTAAALTASPNATPPKEGVER
jgi:hypothetical protein